MRREEVARNQRVRLHGAMIESISQRGYDATSVAHVIALAGVSRRAFYEQFSNKEECFVATYDIVVARARNRAVAAWQREHGWANRLHAACRALFDDVAESPKEARLVLIDSLGVGTGAGERVRHACLAFERLLAAALQVAPDGTEFPALTARALVGGVRSVLFMRVLENRERELHTLSDELLDWIESYRLSGAAAPSAAFHLAQAPVAAPVPAAFPAGDEERRRALLGAVELAASEGYARLSDPQIAAFAGISIEAFHERFADKQDCLLAALDEFRRGALDAVASGLEGAPSWAEAVPPAMSAFVAYLRAHQALARVALIDASDVGPAVIGSMTSSIDDLSRLLTEGAPAPSRDRPVARQAIAGAVWAIVSSYVAEERLSRLACLIEPLAFIVLAPHVGSAAALRSLQDARQPPRAA